MRFQSLIFFILAPLLITSGCNRGGGSVQSKDGHITVVLPSGWEQTQLPNSHGKIDAKNTLGGGYASVLAESRGDFDNIDIARYAKMCMDISARNTKLDQRVVFAPENTTVNGKPAIRYHVTGDHNGVKVIFDHTFFTGNAYFIQVMCWGTPSHYDADQRDFDSIVSSVVDKP
jgi:hypothetical protein